MLLKGVFKGHIRNPSSTNSPLGLGNSEGGGKGLD